MKNQNEILNFYDILDIIKNNVKTLIVILIIFLSIPNYLIYKSYNKNNYSISIFIETNPSIRFDFMRINKLINQLYQNQLFNDINYRLNIFYTDFLSIDNSQEIISTRDQKFEDILFIDELFIKNALINSDFFNDKINFIFPKKDKDIPFQLPIIFNNGLNVDEINNVEIFIEEILLKYNSLINFEIKKIINQAQDNYYINKNRIITSLNKSNQLIEESYKYSLVKKINDLKDKLKLVKSVELDPKFKDLDMTSIVNISNDSLYNKEIVNISALDIFQLIQLGSEAIEKQISLATNQLEDNITIIPEVYANNQLLSLINSDFFDQELINDDYFPFNAKEIFYLTKYEIVNNSISLNLAMLFSFISIIISIIFSIIIIIILQFLRKK